MPSTINAQPGNATAFTSLIKTGAADANLALQTNGTNAVTIDNAQNANFVVTTAITSPRGTTAQRPSPAVNGMFRYNTSNSTFEAYINNAWTFIP